MCKTIVARIRGSYAKALAGIMMLTACGLGMVACLRADEPLNIILLSDSARECKQPKFLHETDLLLRPNSEQRIYLFVQNPDVKAEKEFHVTLDAGTALLENKNVKLKPGAKTLVVFDRVPPESPASGDKKLPQLTFPDFQFKIAVKEIGKGQAAPIEASKVFAVKLLSPGQYLKEPTVTRGKIKVAAKEEFCGPDCPVQIELRRDRSLDLIKGPIQQISENKRTIQLSPPSLTFSEPRSEEIGRVYLSVDNVKRAFQFSAHFAPGEVWKGEPVKPTVLRLNVPAYADPAAKALKDVVVEVDNYPLSLKATVELYQVPGDDPRPGTMITSFERARKQEVWVTPQKRDGALLFSSKVNDLAAPEISLEGLTGKCTIGARIRNENGEPIAQEGDKDGFVYASVTLIKDPPKNLHISKEAVAGGKLRLIATCADPPEQIQAVQFCWGQHDGKTLPAKAEKVPAELKLADGKAAWVAELEIPEKAGDHEFSVEFKNKVHKSSFKTSVYTVPTAAAQNGRLVVTVKHGADQKRFLKVTVKKTDMPNQKVEKELPEANKDGKYEFKDLPDGTYTITCADPGAGTAGQTTAGGQKGEQAEVTVELKLK